MVKIKDWYFSDINFKPLHGYLLPETSKVIIGDLYLCGIAENHPDFSPEEPIRTSAVEYVEYDMCGNLIVGCKNRMYLAEISSEDELKYDRVIEAANTLLHRRASLIALAHG